jgi:hypothetical protein
MRQADHLSRGSLLGVCVCVIIYDLETSKRGGLGATWVVAPQKKYSLYEDLFIYTSRDHTASPQ